LNVQVAEENTLYMRRRKESQSSRKPVMSAAVGYAGECENE
jgi:hypothetical protein